MPSMPPMPPPTLDRQIQEMNEVSRLGPAVGSPIELAPQSHSEAVGPLALLVFALAVLAAAGWMRTNPSVAPYAIYCAAAGFLLLALAGVFLFRRRLERGTLTLHERGFTFARGGESTALAFDEVESLALEAKERLSNGRPIGIFRRATVGGPAGKVRFDQLTRNGQPDHLGGFLDKLLARLAAAAEERLRNGVPLTGGAWSLAQDGFRAQADGAPTPPATLARVGIFDQHVSLWREGEERPFFSVASGSPNALVLDRVMRQRLRGRPEPALAAGQLGRILFERSQRQQAAVAGVVGLIAAAAASWSFAAADPGKAKILWGLVGLLGVCTLGICVVVLWARVARRHENGLSLSTLTGRREILFVDAERMKYSATRYYHKGVYAGTKLYLRVWAAEGKPVTFAASAKGTEVDLDGLRDDLAGRIAAKLKARLAHEPDVPWTPGVRLSRQGIRLAKRFGAEVMIPYRQKPTFQLKRGYFSLSAPGIQGKMTTACAAENFYPGFILLKALATEAAKTA